MADSLGGGDDVRTHICFDVTTSLTKAADAVAVGAFAAILVRIAMAAIARRYDCQRGQAVY